jgi:outer membrane protein OmpA-like peptidoglycan-associated protein
MKKTMVQSLPIRTFQKCILPLFILFGFSQTITAQHRIGLANGNYGGITNLMGNPADIASGRYRTYIGLAQTDLHLTNNYLGFSQFIKSSADTVSFLKKDGDYLSAGLDFAGISWIQRINANATVALATRTRGGFQAVGITRNLYRQFDSYFSTNTTQVADIKGGGLNANAQVFSEIAASYAHTLVDNGSAGLKFGATVKRLNGLFSTGFSLSNFDAQYSKVVDDERYKITSGQLKIASIAANSNLNDVTNLSPADIFKSKGSGWGFDVGATYELRSGSFTNEDGSTPYQVRIGAAVTDIGNIKYSGSNIRYYDINLKNVNFKVSDTADLGASDDILRAAGANPDSFATSFKTQIPTMLRLNADVRVTKNFFINAYLGHSLANRYDLGTQYASFIALTPRLESRYVDFSLPLALTNNYKTFAMGFGLRLGPVTLGMDNFLGFGGNASGLNGHAGLNIGIGRKKRTELTAEEKEKAMDAEVQEAKTASKDKSKKKSKKSPKDDPLSNEPMKKTEVVAAPKPVEMPESEAKPMPEASKPRVVNAKPTPTTPAAKPAEMPAKTPATVATTPKPTTMPAAKPAEIPAKTPATAATTLKPTTTTPAKAPLSTTPAKTAAVVAVPKVIEKNINVTIAPVGSGKMGECIEFYPNKAAISGNSMACLREISKFLISNKNIKLNVSGNVLPTEKVADAAALKTERAKAIRNFLIQSGVEAARLAVKPSTNAGDAPVVLTAQ